MKKPAPAQVSPVSQSSLTKQGWPVAAPRSQSASEVHEVGATELSMRQLPCWLQAVGSQGPLRSPADARQLGQNEEIAAADDTCLSVI